MDNEIQLQQIQSDQDGRQTTGHMDDMRSLVRPTLIERPSFTIMGDGIQPGQTTLNEQRPFSPMLDEDLQPSRPLLNARNSFRIMEDEIQPIQPTPNGRTSFSGARPRQSFNAGRRSMGARPSISFDTGGRPSMNLDVGGRTSMGVDSSRRPSMNNLDVGGRRSLNYDLVGRPSMSFDQPSRPGSSMSKQPAIGSRSGSRMNIKVQATSSSVSDLDFIVMPRRRFKSSRLIGEYEKPWLETPNKRRKYDYIIFWGGCLIGLIAGAVLCYLAWASVPNNEFCLYFEDNFQTINPDTWEHEIQRGGFGTGSFDWTTDDPANSYVDAEGLHIVPTLTTESTNITKDQLFDDYVLNLTTAGSCTLR